MKKRQNRSQHSHLQEAVRPGDSARDGVLPKRVERIGRSQPGVALGSGLCADRLAAVDGDAEWLCLAELLSIADIQFVEQTRVLSLALISNQWRS